MADPGFFDGVILGAVLYVVAQILMGRH